MNSRFNKGSLGIKLQHIFESPNFDHEEFNHTEVLFQKALKEEKIYWKDKVRVAWLKEGDKNTSFFHAMTVQQRQ